QKTVALAGTGRLSAEVEGWIARLTPEQRSPVSLDLSVEPLIMGQVANLQVEHANSGETVHYFLNLAGTGQGPCIPAFGICFELLLPFYYIGPAAATSAGVATLGLSIPTGLPLGLTVHFEALVLRGANSKTSNAVTQTTR
ncbi:MAG: hypothetical protein L0Y54_19385, partial [Sporichthyaceae bacterium]|nr:hypothetical protein [Sporichthyaceae bacterium]